MSHFTNVQSSMTRESCIIKALIAMGFKQSVIEVSSDTKMQLKGYSGTIDNSRQANIRIKGNGWSGQNHVGGLSTDLGFERMQDGTYAIHMDNARFRGDWKQRLMQQYSKAVIQEVSEEQNFFIEEEIEEDGKILIQVTSPF